MMVSIPAPTTFDVPLSWADALYTRAAQPELVPICGGTDLLVELNFARRRPAGLLDLSKLSELKDIRDEDAEVVIGAGVTFRRIERELAAEIPALATAARTVGSPQIRNRATIGGNLATASPAGDAHPVLMALGATVVVESTSGQRQIAIDDFFVGPKLSSLRPDELIHSVRVPRTGAPQHFAKVGGRNAMVIATVSFALAIHEGLRRVGTGIGSAGPTPLRATAAEEYLAGALEDTWDDPAGADDEIVTQFGTLVAESARPIDDVRGSAAYRVHALGVLARRCLRWCWDERFTGQTAR